MNISHALKNHGKSITQERLDIFDGIKNLHLFQAIDVRAMFPQIGRASIFRTLSLFVGIGILRKLSLEDRGDFYELIDQKHHEHFECQKCHKILHFHAGILCKTLEYLAKKQGYLLQNHQIFLSGICPSCHHS